MLKVVYPEALFYRRRPVYLYKDNTRESRQLWLRYGLRRAFAVISAANGSCAFIDTTMVNNDDYTQTLTLIMNDAFPGPAHERA